MASKSISLAATTNVAGATSKLKGKERRQSIGHNRLRKKRDGTPEKSATPSQEPDESLTPARQVIWDEELEKLQLKTEDLSKVWEPRPPELEKPITTKLGYVRKSKKLTDEEKPASRLVSVAKPAPPDAEVKPMDYTGYAGPRYDENGHVIPYSLLGTYEDFQREAVKRGDLGQELPSPRDQDRGGTPTLKYEKKKKGRELRLSQDENNALRNWQIKMMERKRQQGYISKLLQKSPEDLAMNQADNYRTIQEKRYLIDRTIPKIDYGKGYRVGSEFWHQQEKLGDDLGGLHMTLNQSQRGYPAPVERIGLSKMVKGEKGCEWLGTNAPHMNYPWHKSPFLDKRQQQLQPFIEEMAPLTPDFEGLQVIGRNQPYYAEMKQDGDEEKDEAFDNLLDSYGQQTDVLLGDEQMEGQEEGEEGGRDEGEVVEGEKAPVFGPSLLFGSQPARWTGDSFSFKDQVGIEARVTFEALTGDRITSHLELINDGTTSIYYDWKKIAKENPFDLVTAQVQRFYFNNSSGVILPGETLKFPYVFKSPNAGVFTEQWLLETRPVLCGGAALLVTLRGVALQEDKFKKQREELEKELLSKQAQQVVSHLLDEILSGMRTPERSRSPVDAYLTEEEIFRRNNPRLQYSHELVASLKELYSQLFEEEYRAENVWSLSIEDLEQSILELDDEEDEKRESLLHQMNALVAKLSYIPHVPIQDKLQSAGLKLFQEAVDHMVGEALMLRQYMGLPDREQDELDGDMATPGPGSETRDDLRTPMSGDSRKGMRAAADGKSKADAGKDKGKATGKDAKGSKTPSGKQDVKGKTTPGPPPKKTPTPVKAPAAARAPTPGDAKDADAPSSQPSSPDPSASTSMNDTELAAAEKLYKDHLAIKTYGILGEMLENMDRVFAALKEDHKDS